MWEFKRSGESIVLDDGKIHTNLNYILEREDDTVVVEIPSLKVLFETHHAAIEDIQHKATTTLESYFKYWISQKGLESFISNMLQLGFRLQKSSPGEIQKPIKITPKKLHLDLSY